MMPLDEALKIIKLNAPKTGNVVGPRGGDVNNPNLSPEFRKSGFNGSIEKGLHRFVDEEDVANRGIKDEKVWHRMAGYMIVAGRTDSEIAIAAGVRPGEVAILKQQRWFQELLATIANQDGQEIVGLLKSEVLASIVKLASLRDFAESESVQATCARTLIEQSEGKPVQKVITDNVHRRGVSPQDEMDAIRQELEMLRGHNGATI